MKRNFTEEELEEIEAPWNNVWSEITDQGRWETFHRGVIEFDGKFWMIDWTYGSTEMQEDSSMYPWDSYPVVGEEVSLQDVTVQKWLPVV